METVASRDKRRYEAARASAVKPLIRGTMTSAWCEAAGIRTTRRDGSYSLCRALLSAGYAGSLLLHDADTGMERIFVRDIARAALWTVRENDSRGPHVCRYVEADFSAITGRKQDAPPDLPDDDEI